MKRREALKQTSLILGYTVSMGTVSSLLASCDKGTELTWTPTIFTKEQAQTLSALVDLIIPKTSTPGALELGIDQFIDKFVGSVYEQEDRLKLQDGLDGFTAGCKAKYGSFFHQCNIDQKHDEMKLLESSIINMPASFWGQSIDEDAVIPFYSNIKELTLLGFFSSEQIGKQQLSYLPIPGEFLGCIPLSDIGNSWAE